MFGNTCHLSNKELIENEAAIPKLQSGTKVHTPVREDGTSDGPGIIIGSEMKGGCVWPTRFNHVMLLEKKSLPSGHPVRVYSTQSLIVIG